MNANETHAEDARHNVMISDMYVGRHRVDNAPLIIRDANTGDTLRIAGDLHPAVEARYE